MTTITATVAPDGAGTSLTITPNESITSIARIDATGTYEVRTPAGYLPWSAGARTLVDYEAPLTGPVTYRAGNAAVTVAAPAAPVPWLINPQDPSKSVALVQVTEYGAGRVSQTIVHEVPGRRQPLLNLGELAGRTGTLGLWCETATDGRRLEAALDGTVLLLKAPTAGMDMFFTALATQLDPDEDNWMLSVDYQEADRPAGLAPAWTFAGLRDGFASFAAVRTGFEDFAGVADNDRAGVTL
jgi:hypothetical protein